MSLDEFYEYWESEYNIIDLTEEYSNAQSENEKMKILGKYKLRDYKAEVERAISLDKWASDKFDEDAAKPWEQVTTVEDFQASLDSMNVHDCEKKYLISTHLAGLIILWCKKTSKKSKRIKNNF